MSNGSKNQTTSSRDWNMFALAGDAGITDQDVIKQYDLDPALAGTPEINDAAIDAQYRWNLDHGMSERDAREAKHYAKMRVKRVMARMK